MKIRAAVLGRMGAAPPDADSRPLRIAILELEPLGRGEVLVRIAAAGLCTLPSPSPSGSGPG